MITNSITHTLSSSLLHSWFKPWETSNRPRMDLFTRRYLFPIYFPLHFNLYRIRRWFILVFEITLQDFCVLLELQSPDFGGGVGDFLNISRSEKVDFCLVYRAYRLFLSRPSITTTGNPRVGAGE
jgi:hypothetical protein